MEPSIALEALLAERATENTYKVGLRAALLAGGDHQQRAQNRATVSAVYALRSVVHEGVAPETAKVKGKGHIASTTVVGEAAAVTATVIRRVISAGKLPGTTLNCVPTLNR